jgi:DNA-binding CsgD family transcriptional regulator
VLVLYGREAERSALARLLDDARESRSGVLVLRGEPGVGKSALLLDAIEQAEGMQVVHAFGVEAESELAYAGLHQVSWPLLRHVDEIPAPQAQALRGALGLTVADGTDRFLVSAALLSLLAAAAEERPMFAVIDDAHWLDDPSSDALTFAARRLQAEPIALVFSAREGDPRAFEAPGLPELRLTGLEPEAAEALLIDDLGDAASTAVLGQIVETAAGNPLALLEMPRALTADQLAGAEPLRDQLPLTPNLEQVFIGRARNLPETGRLLLLLAAADDTGDATVVLAGARALEIDDDAVAAVESTGLARFRDGVITFRHPLARSSVYQSATFEQRRVAHLALVEVLTGEANRDRRAWHRAAATIGFDESVAAELEATALRASRRSGYAATSAALERASELTAEDEVKARRLAGAADAAWLGGRPLRTVSLLEWARRLTSAPSVRADIDHLRALVELQHGVPADAHDILMNAEAEIAFHDPEKAAAMLVSAGEAAAFAGDTAGEIAAGTRATELLESAPGLFELSMMAGIAALLSGDAATAGRLLRAAIESAEASDNPRRLFWAGSCSLYLLDETAARKSFARAVEQTRSAGAISMLAFALVMLAWAEVLEGRVLAAASAASEGGRLARDTGQENAACFASAILAWTAGVLGREEGCRTHAAEVLRLSEERGLAIQGALALWALGELELGAGQASDAFPHLARLAVPEPGRRHAAFAGLTFPDLVESAVRAGRLEDVPLDVEPFERWISGVGSHSRAPLVARCRALLAADDETALAQFEDALRLHAEVPRPFESARTRLLFGERLRRSRQPRAAREHFRAALEVFERLHAEGWAERTRAELRASGESARKRDPSTVDRLTAQEIQIARIVAGGATNKDVAAQLFLSPRTIDFHLRNVYSKLGISSRHELAGLGLAEEDDPVVQATTPATSPVRA